MKTIITVLAVLLVAGGVIWYANKGDDTGSGYTPAPNASSTGTNNGSNSGSNPAGSAQNSDIRVTSPLANSIVASPLTVTGEAKGTWYFEASFPMKLVDGNGKVLAQAPAQAQGEWMTTNFVPFKGTLTFSAPTTATGTLILEKDNPSGLSSNAAEIRIPVKFSSSSAQMRTVKIYTYDESRDKDANGNILCSSKGLVAVNHNIPFTNTPIQDAVRELLRTDPAFAGVSLIVASQSGSTLTLTFSDPQNKTSGGSCKVAILWAKVEATAKQFGGVATVRFSPSTLFQP